MFRYGPNVQRDTSYAIVFHVLVLSSWVPKISDNSVKLQLKLYYDWKLSILEIVKLSAQSTYLDATVILIMYTVLSNLIYDGCRLELMSIFMLQNVNKF